MSASPDLGHEPLALVPSAAMRPPMPERPRPVVLVGAGGIVRDAHLPAYRKAGFPVVAVVNRDLARARRLASDFAIPAVHGSLDEAIAAAPPGTVFDLALPAAAQLDALERLPTGASVLIQKPMGENLEQATRFRRVCEERHLNAAVNFQLRYAPAVLAARNLIARGVIGELTDLEIRIAVRTPWHLWPFLRDVPFAEIYYHSIHYLDLCRSFLGDPAGVWASTLPHPATPGLDGSRSMYILDYGARVRVTISANHHHGYGDGHAEAFIQWSGTAGAIRATLGVLMRYPEGAPDRFELCELRGEVAQWRDLPIRGSWFPDAFIGTMASVMRSADGLDLTPATAPADAWQTMLLADAAVRSSQSGATRV